MEVGSRMGLPPPLPALPSTATTTTWARGGCIGSGSFGTVSFALDRSSGRVFAVKSSPASSSAAGSLENEIRILRSVSSPYVVSYIGDDTTVESATEVNRNLLMEYVPGGTVAGVAARCREKRGAMDEPAVRSYTRCVARALQYLHSVGVVHGDVKGRNVLAGSATGKAKLADFGSARRISGGGEGSCAGVDQPRGTPLWMAPEVVRGEPTTPASDVWSLGCTVIEMATGRPPWSECGHYDAGHLLLRIALGDEVPQSSAQLSKSGRDFLDRCLRRDPAERWSCERLLLHPFLVEEAPAAEQSPRSALEWANFGFDSEEDEEEVFEKFSRVATAVTGDHSTTPGDDLRGRVSNLASTREATWEDTDGWEAVRSVHPSILPCLAPDEAGEAMVIMAEGGTEGASPEFQDCEGRGWEDRRDDVRQELSPNLSIGYLSRST